MNSATNIKDRRVRNDVISALKSGAKLMNKKHPKSQNGYVLCVGITQEEGMVCEIIIPPHRLNRDDYLCSKRFEIEPLLDMCYSRSDNYGVIISRGHVTEFYTIIQTGKHITCKLEQIYKTRIPRSHSRGGQSQARIGRIHDSLVTDMIMEIIKRAIMIYGDERIGTLKIKSLLLCGTATIKDVIADRLVGMPIGANITTAKSGEDVARILFIEHKTSLFLTPSLTKYHTHLVNLIETDYDLILIGYDEVSFFRDHDAIEFIYVTTMDMEEEMIAFNNGDISYNVIRLEKLPLNECMGIKRPAFREFNQETLRLVME